MFFVEGRMLGALAALGGALLMVTLDGSFDTAGSAQLSSPAVVTTVNPESSSVRESAPQIPLAMAEGRRKAIPSDICEAGTAVARYQPDAISGTGSFQPAQFCVRERSDF